MPGQRGRSYSVRRAQKRQTFWISTAGAAAWTALAGSTKAIANSFTGAQVSAFAPFTIVRTVGLLAVRSDQSAASENQFGAYAHMVVTELARAAGAASIPGPITDAADDMWFLYQYFQNSIRVATAVGFEGNSGKTFSFDSRAQRKVEDGMAIVDMIENVSTTGLQFWVENRQLLKVH